MCAESSLYEKLKPLNFVSIILRKKISSNQNQRTLIDLFSHHPPTPHHKTNEKANISFNLLFSSFSYNICGPRWTGKQSSTSGYIFLVSCEITFSPSITNNTRHANPSSPAVNIIIWSDTLWCHFTRLFASDLVSLMFPRFFSQQQVRPESTTTMRVLAKFIGYIISRPFNYDNYRNTTVDNRQIELRNTVSNLMFNFIC